MKIDATKLPVMNACCGSCPFKEDENGRQLDPILAAQVQQRTLFKAHQICHATEEGNRVPKNRCKGAFDANMEVYERMGFGHLVAK